MGFVKFTEVGKNFTPKVSINPRGMMSFNQGAKRKFNLDKFTHAVLYFDPACKTVGCEMTNDETTEGAHKLRVKENSVEVNARSFLSFFEIEPQVTQTFGLVQGPDTTWLVIDLNGGQQPVRADGNDDHEPDIDHDDDNGLDIDFVAAMDDDEIVVVPVNVNCARDEIEMSQKRAVNSAINGHHKPVPPRRSVKALLGELLSD